jgi:hypothetical protein
LLNVTVVFESARMVNRNVVFQSTSKVVIINIVLSNTCCMCHEQGKYWNKNVI